MGFFDGILDADDYEASWRGIRKKCCLYCAYLGKVYSPTKGTYLCTHFSKTVRSGDVCSCFKSKD